MYFVIFHKSNFRAQVLQDSRSCDEVTFVRPQVNLPVRTAGPVMFHNDCDGPNAFTGPWPGLQKDRKIPELSLITYVLGT